MISWFRFSIFYFVISFLACAFVAMPMYVQSLEYGNFGFNLQTALAVVLILFIPAGLLSLGFRRLNGGADSRRVSAIVLVFFLSIVGIATSFAIGAAFGFVGDFLLKWASLVLGSADVPVLKYFHVAVIYVRISHVFIEFPSLSTVVSIAVFGSFFGLPLARIAKGSRFADAWSQQTGKRWALFWRSGAGVLGISIIWMALDLAVYSALAEPTITGSTLSGFEASFFSEMLRQPPLLMMALRFGMNLLLVSLAVGFVAYYSERVRRELG